MGGTKYTITETESELFCRPACRAGIGILDPVKTAQSQFFKSKEATAHLIDAITKCSPLDLQKHEHAVRNAVKRKDEEEQMDRDESIGLIDTFPAKTQRCIMRKLDFKCSGWLSITPTLENHFDMNPDEFRDSLALRYGRTPCKMPSLCDGDGEIFDVDHALNCAKGGLVYARHNELRDLNCSLLELAGLKQILSEPIVTDDGEELLRADWAARGFWESQKQALFDGCVVNADSPSLQNSSLEAIFNQRKQRKNKTYKEAAEARRATFSPIIATCDAVFDKEAEIYFKRLAVHLSQKWKSNYSVTLGFIRARMQLCILRSVSLCLRGSRTKWRSGGRSSPAEV